MSNLSCSGNTKLFFNLLWCVLIALLLTWLNHQNSEHKTSATHLNIESVSQCGNYLQPQSPGEAISDQVVSFLGKIWTCFLLFFFWSWENVPNLVETRG